jgi:hypothetical protein
MANAPSRKELRTFGLSLGGACLVWAGILWWRGKPDAARWLVMAAPVLAVIGLTVPIALRPLHAVWMPMAKAVARALTWLLLTLVYYLVFTPYGMLMRILGKDPLQRRLDRSASSYWIRRQDGPFDPSRTTKQF